MNLLGIIKCKSSVQRQYRDNPISVEDKKCDTDTTHTTLLSAAFCTEAKEET